MDRATFELIKRKYGHYASWAIWADEGRRPKDHVGDLSIFDIERDDSFLVLLNPRFVFVGLNISRPVVGQFGNFHDPRPQAMDYKLRYAFKNSPFWGAYMTDIIKDFEQKVSGKVMDYLRKNKHFEDENIKSFRVEISDLGGDNPTLVAFGNDAHNVLCRNLKEEFKILKIPHYSAHIGKERYQEIVKSMLEF